MDTPLRISLNDFVVGAERSEPWCRQRFADYIDDIDQDWDPQLAVDVPGHPHYFISESTDSVLLLFRCGDAVELVGYYNTPGAVCIRDDHQGKGLGAELILYTAVHVCGGAPTAGLDEQCFSEAGLRAHRAAWRLGVARGWIEDPVAPTISGRKVAP
jgi:GNAT superfamily N-acetyltransferase